MIDIINNKLFLFNLREGKKRRLQSLVSLDEGVYCWWLFVCCWFSVVMATTTFFFGFIVDEVVSAEDVLGIDRLLQGLDHFQTRVGHHLRHEPLSDLTNAVVV